MNEMDDDRADAVVPEQVPVPADPGGGAPSTGDSRVDSVLRGLDSLPGLPVAEHPHVFERAHAGLAEVLEELRSGGDLPDSGH